MARLSEIIVPRKRQYHPRVPDTMRMSHSGECAEGRLEGCCDELEMDERAIATLRGRPYNPPQQEGAEVPYRPS